MEPRTIGSYTGPKTDAEPVSNITQQLPSSAWNRQAEDTAQLTRTAPRAIVVFTATAVAPPTTVAAANVTVRSLWGTGDAAKPTVSKTATGQYSLAFSTSYNDGLGESETLGFIDAECRVRTGAVADDLEGHVVAVTANTVTIEIESPRNTAADVGNSSGTPLTVGVTIY